MDTLGERVKYVRKKKKLTQKKFGEKLGISQTHVSKIEKDVENPSEILIKFISYLYCVDYEWLKTGKGSPDLNLNCEVDGLINRYYLAREEFEKTIEVMNSDMLYEFYYAYLHFTQVMTAPSLETQKYKWKPQLYVSYYRYLSSMMCSFSHSIQEIFEIMVDKSNVDKSDIIEYENLRTRAPEVINELYNSLLDLILKFEKN